MEKNLKNLNGNDLKDLTIKYGKIIVLDNKVYYGLELEKEKQLTRFFIDIYRIDKFEKSSKLLDMSLLHILTNAYNRKDYQKQVKRIFTFENNLIIDTTYKI
jgi:hypothetical protein